MLSQRIPLGMVAFIRRKDGDQRASVHLREDVRVGPLQKLIPDRSAQEMTNLLVDVPPLEIAYQCNTVLSLVIDRYQQRLHRALSYLLNEYDAVEDVLQLTWIKLHDHWMKAGQLPAPLEKLYPWLKVVARNLALSYIKEGNNLASLDLLEESSWLQYAQSNPFDRPDTLLLRKEIMEHIFQAIGEIPPPQRIQVILHYLEDLTLDEIAQALQLPPGTVRARVYRALPKLRTMLLALGITSADLDLWARSADLPFELYSHERTL